MKYATFDYATMKVVPFKVKGSIPTISPPTPIVHSPSLLTQPQVQFPPSPVPQPQPQVQFPPSPQPQPQLPVTPQVYYTSSPSSIVHFPPPQHISVFPESIVGQQSNIPYNPMPQQEQNTGLDSIYNSYVTFMGSKGK